MLTKLGSIDINAPLRVDIVKIVQYFFVIVIIGMIWSLLSPDIESKLNPRCVYNSMGTPHYRVSCILLNECECVFALQTDNVHLWSHKICPDSWDIMATQLILSTNSSNISTRRDCRLTPTVRCKNLSSISDWILALEMAQIVNENGIFCLQVFRKKKKRKEIKRIGTAGFDFFFDQFFFTTSIEAR